MAAFFLTSELIITKFNTRVWQNLYFYHQIQIKSTNEI